jgi:hypothetical protein
MHLTRRLAVAVAAATFAGALLSTPAAHAEGSYECFSATLKHTQHGYDLSGLCDGVGYVDVVVTVLFGAAAGTYRCSTAFSWNGFLGAHGCRLE